MKVKELIEELKKFDENMEVQYDYDGRYSTMPIDEDIKDFYNATDKLMEIIG